VDDFTLDGLLGGLTDVVEALSVNQALFVSRMRELQHQLEQKESGAGRPTHPSGSTLSHSLGSEPRTATTTRSEKTYRTGANGVGPAASSQGSNQPPTSWPMPSDEGARESSNEKRDYNFFAELDEKLAGLRKQR